MGNIHTPAINASDAMKEPYGSHYWEALNKKRALSNYLRDWDRQPEWVWKKARGLEESLEVECRKRHKLEEALYLLVLEFDLIPQDDYWKDE